MYEYESEDDQRHVLNDEEPMHIVEDCTDYHYYIHNMIVRNLRVTQDNVSLINCRIKEIDFGISSINRLTITNFVPYVIWYEKKSIVFSLLSIYGDIKEVSYSMPYSLNMKLYNEPISESVKITKHETSFSIAIKLDPNGRKVLEKMGIDEIVDYYLKNRN